MLLGREFLLDRNRLHLGVVAFVRFFEEFGGANNAIAGISGIVPGFNLYALAFKVLIYREEMCDFLEHVRVDVGVVPDICVARIVLADGEDFLIESALVKHLEEADGADFVNAAGECGVRDKNKDVEGVTVVAQSRRYEAVVAGIVNG